MTYVNSSRTVLAWLAGGFIIFGIALFFTAASRNDSAANESEAESIALLWIAAVTLTSVGVLAFFAWLVAKSVSYDAWYRSPDATEWRIAEAERLKKRESRPAELDRSDRIPSRD